ncbi:MAG: SpaH/EbpB family LPXTG-anchored major pilin [Faecousia sp.]
MKQITKFASLLLALVMVFSLAITAAAEETPTTGSLTINETVNGKTYELYKIFDLVYDYTGTEETPANLRVSYTIDTDWVSFFENAGAKYIVDANNAENSLSPILVDGTIRYINITEDNVEAFSIAAQNYLIGIIKENKTICDTSVTGTGSNKTVSNLPLGYYLVYVPGATEWAEGRNCLCSLTVTVPNGVVDIKAVYPNIEKESSTTIGADIGETVTFTITGKIPDTTGYDSYTYVITDTMSEGLTFNADSIRVAIKGAGADGADLTLAEETHYTCTKNDNGFELTVKVRELQDYVGAELTVTYSAVVNEKAIQTVSENTAYLTYSDRPNQEQSTSNTRDQPAKADVYSSNIVIDKVDAKEYEAAATDEAKAAATRLEGAKFVLRKNVGTTEAPVYQYYKYQAPDTETGTDAQVQWINVAIGDSTTPAEAISQAAAEGTITAVTTDENGQATFQGLKDGTYELKEIAAPRGYNLLLDPAAVTVDGSAATAEDLTPLTMTAVVGNAAGTALPSTGGIGTTIFYVVGFILVIGATVLLVTRKRMSAER